jgi:LacI family transcriptional regulator
MRPLEQFCCQNPKCALHGQRGQGNIKQKGWSSKAQSIRRLICSVCRKRFSERKGTALYGSRIKTEKAINVLKHLADHNGIRQTARLTGTYKDAVNRLALLDWQHAEKVHDELVAFSPEHQRGPTRRKMVVRRKKRKALRSGKPR